MINHVYKIECITNLHVGSGDVNYNIIDNEVERDPVTGYPVVHASGLKGALRKHFSKKLDREVIESIFGQEPEGKTSEADSTGSNSKVIPGSYKFTDANLLARPMRVSGQIASIMVVSERSVNDFIRMMNLFGIDQFGCELIEPLEFPENINFLTDVVGINSIEDEEFAPLSKQSKQAADVINRLSGIIGTKYAVVKDFNDYDLPVAARNKLDDGESKHLWYEEIVPHDSIFYTLIMTPGDSQMELNSEIIQIGGHASIGCGFTKFSKLCPREELS